MPEHMLRTVGLARYNNVAPINFVGWCFGDHHWPVFNWSPSTHAPFLPAIKV